VYFDSINKKMSGKKMKGQKMDLASFNKKQIENDLQIKPCQSCLRNQLVYRIIFLTYIIIIIMIKVEKLCIGCNIEMVIIKCFQENQCYNVNCRNSVVCKILTSIFNNYLILIIFSVERKVEVMKNGILMIITTMLRY